MDKLAKMVAVLIDRWTSKSPKAAKITTDVVSKAFKVDFVKNPDLLKEAPYAMLSAGFFWHTHKLNKLADIEDLDRICVAINGGYNGLEHRKELYNKLING